MEQQQQQPPPQVLVIQQPVVVDSEANRTHPSIRRGVQFNNGCHIPGSLFITMGSVGLALFFLGCSLVNSGGKMKEIGIFMIIFGVMGVLSCCFLCDKAHRDYKALPEDHPDRIKYSGVVPVPIRNIGTTCQLPPGTQVVSYPASTGGQAVGSSSTGRETVRHPPSTGRQIVGSSSTGRQAVGSPSTGGQPIGSPSTGGQPIGSPSTRGQPIGSPSTGGQAESRVTPSAPPASTQYAYDDAPPSYAEATKNTM